MSNRTGNGVGLHLLPGEPPKTHSFLMPWDACLLPQHTSRAGVWTLTHRAPKQTASVRCEVHILGLEDTPIF